MLVLSRMESEQVVIGDNISITILEVRGDRVKLGFIAPPEIPIHRREMYEEIVKQRLIEQKERARRDSND